jgi:hypothetical protein
MAVAGFVPQLIVRVVLRRERFSDGVQDRRSGLRFASARHDDLRQKKGAALASGAKSVNGDVGISKDPVLTQYESDQPSALACASVQ